MLNKFQTYLSSFIEKNPAEHFFIAVSGGHDSMLLLDTCRICAIPITVLHVNYQLRGEESDDDQTFIEQYCQTHALPLKVKRIDLQEKLTSGGNLQQLARKERYDFFESHLNQVTNSCLMVAQHQDDQLETFWLQLFRGAGMSGLQGMLKKNGRILRPLLPFSRTQLAQISQKANLKWREDSSNASTKYLRNLFRLKLLPELEAKIPSLRESIQTVQRVFQEALKERENEIQALSERIKNDDIITLNELTNIPDYLLVEVFKKLQIPAVFTKKMTILIEGEVGKQYSWQADLNAPFQSMMKERDGIRFIPNDSESSVTPSFDSEFIREIPRTFDKNSLYLDHSKIQGNLYIRKWQEGDRMYPIGLKGSKLISDILKDDHVPTSKKSNCFVLCDDEKIICCIGHRIDRRCIADHETKLVIRIDIQQ
ncbi:MAG: tRNA lysidine(34) synthetase TilS [Crocinitomicaceae bacterium]|jgi:tRNA(Ile)-lysidine synthase|nr:tRNA lysidine(34) synthetase TilS [Crocinitomicaceae bacterium]MDP4760204.1 tRNA lysidine(34) synthetase TilS [Crocinitomicaceae bacterium]